MNFYVTIAHYVAKVLRIRPSEILDTWGVAELIVAYGQYANEEYHRHFMEWKAQNQKNYKPTQPPEYAVKFFGIRDLEE